MGQGAGAHISWVLSRTGLILACSGPGTGLSWPSRARDVTKPPLTAVKGKGFGGEEHAT